MEVGKLHKVKYMILSSVLIIMSIFSTACGSDDASEENTVKSGFQPVFRGEDDSADDEEELDGEITWANVETNDMFGDLIVTILDNKMFENSKCIINNKDLRNEGKAIIISEVSSSSSSGEYYDGSYEVIGSNLESSVFHLEPQKQSGEVGLGINYFSCLQEISAIDFASADFKYAQYSQINGVVGNFKLTIYAYDDENRDKLGCDSVKISATTGESTGDVKCTITDQCVSIDSTVDVSDIVVEVTVDGETESYTNDPTNHLVIDFSK